MTIKTPEQIAADTARPDALDCPMCGIRHPYITHWPCAGAFDDARVVAAIEADRAQRADALDALHAWAVSMSYSLGTDKSNDWTEELAELAKIEREYGLVDDDAEPTPDPEAEDYGKYLDQQFWGDH